MFKILSSALSFLSIIRLPFTSPMLTAEELAASFSAFPLAGLILGGIYYTAAFCLRGHVPPLVLAALITALMVILTRGLHYDGLADLADGVWGGATPERRLEIMKDSRSGAFGVLALILDLLLKVASIHALVLANSLAPILFAPIFGRVAMTAAAYRATYARAKGLGKPFLENMLLPHLLIAVASAILFVAFINWRALFYALPVLACVALLRTLANRLLGGITGDVLGATCEITEIVILVIASSISFSD